MSVVTMTQREINNLIKKQSQQESALRTVAARPAPGESGENHMTPGVPPLLSTLTQVTIH